MLLYVISMKVGNHCSVKIQIEFVRLMEGGGEYFDLTPVHFLSWSDEQTHICLTNRNAPLGELMCAQRI